MNATSARATILAVDDTPQNLELLDECLSPDYRVKVAISGERALALCAADPPDLVVLDVMMPGMDGFEVLRRLKADAATRAIPVIFATAKDDKTDEQLGLQLGAADYVTKPIHLPILLARIKTHLALYAYQRNLEQLVKQRTAELSEALRRVQKDEKQLQASMTRLAFAKTHDELTGLSNRTHLLHHLGERLQEALLDSSPVALAVINLDRFHVINQVLGVGVGDELLAGMALRLQKALTEPSFIARAGGDEFVVIAQRKSGASLDDLAASALAALDPLLAALRRPVQVQDRSIELTASAGLAVFPADGETPSEMLRNAQRAAAAAKRAGGNRALRFEPRWIDDDAQRFEMEARLRQAIATRQIEPYYQPKVHGATGQLLGAEALMGWPREDGGGYYSPAEFVPLAEQSGLMPALDDLVLLAVLRQLALWKPQLPEGFRIAVNVSSNRFHDGLFPAQMRDWLAETGADPSHLELEITEGALIGDTAACARQLHALRELGLELTLDDFGTGYSSLAYLKQLPLQHLKVDQSFVHDLEHKSQDAAIVRTIITLASALQLKTVAEGIETLSQLKFVYELGCHVVQGFLFSPAVSAARFAEMIAAGRVEMSKGD